MTDNRSTTPAGVFSAADIKRRMAEIAAARAAEEQRRLQAQEEQQKAVMAEFQQPPTRAPRTIAAARDAAGQPRRRTRPD